MCFIQKFSEKKSSTTLAMNLRVSFKRIVIGICRCSSMIFYQKYFPIKVEIFIYILWNKRRNKNSIAMLIECGYDSIIPSINTCQVCRRNLMADAEYYKYRILPFNRKRRHLFDSWQDWIQISKKEVTKQHLVV